MNTEIINQIITPDIYLKNPFFIFRMPIDAISREMRRRKEDVESIFALGQEKEFFADIFEGVNISLSQQEATELYTSLEDPVVRLVYEIFMFWPCGAENSKQDPILREFFNKGYHIKDELFEKWTAVYQTSQDDREVMCAVHNLAVLYHIYSINLEKIRLEGVKQIDLNDLTSYWSEAAKLWRKTLHSDKFWGFLAARAEAINDPRLDARNVRWDFEDILPNSWVAIVQDIIKEYIKKHNAGEVRRLLDIIENFVGASQRESLEINLVKSILRTIERDAKNALDEAHTTPEKGLRLAQKLYDDFIIKKMFVENLSTKNKEHYTDTIDEVVRSIEQCLVSFVNETQEWDKGIPLMEAIRDIAVSSKLREKIESGIDVLTKNDADYKELHMCVVCGKIHHGIEEDVPYKEMTIYSPVDENIYITTDSGNKNSEGVFKRGLLQNPNYGKYQILTFKLPCCKDCRLTRSIAKKLPRIKEKLEQGWSFNEPKPRTIYIGKEPSFAPVVVAGVLFGIIWLLDKFWFKCLFVYD